ncbi:MAG: hypothetical protein LWY06_13720 [Firmicutes bacterium]|nr:hypothetical protein [Bacillota bacterium]
MTRFVKIMILGIIISFPLACLIYSRITAQQAEYVTYHGDFCSFNIREDYQLDYRRQGNSFIYTIYHPGSKDKKLTISSGHKKLKYNIAFKKGYKIQSEGSMKTINTHGVEKKGVTPNENHWREAYIYYSVNTPMGTNASYIYASYDDIDGNQSVVFNNIIDSIQVKDPTKGDFTPKTNQ